MAEDTGLEPVSGNCKSIVNKELTKNGNPVLSTGLDKIVQKYPDLRQLIIAWPELSERDKKAILDIVRK